MTVKKRLSLVLILPFILLVVLMTLFFYTYNGINKVKKQENFHADIVADFYQLSLLGNDIAMYPKEERAGLQWHEKFFKIKSKLEQWKKEPENKTQKEKLYQEYIKLLHVYNRIVESYINKNEFTYKEEYRKLMIGQMQIRMYTLSTNMLKLIKEMKLQILEKEYQYSILVFGLIIAFTFIISWVTWYLIMNILNPLQKLRTGVEMISKGDFTSEIELDTKDELEEFSKTLASMTYNFTSAISQLNNEIAKGKENEKTLQQMNEQLKELDTLKTLFIASMSHELRTPLNAIIGFSGVLKSGLAGPLNEKQKDQLNRILNAGKHLLSMIVEVIDISKIESKQFPFVPESFSLNQLIEELIADLAPKAREKGLKCEQKISQNIAIYTDKRSLKHIIENYITNAIKYSHKGKITVSTKKHEGSVFIEVSDNGIGIASDDMKKLFQPFERLESPMKVLAGGTGLGLYLIKKIVEDLMHGEVYVQSLLGKGSTFGVRIPNE